MDACCGPGYAPGYARRRYFSAAERRQWLEDYASQLENELAGVRERIDKLAA